MATSVSTLEHSVLLLNASKEQQIKLLTHQALSLGLTYTDIYRVVQNLRQLDEQITTEFVKANCGQSPETRNDGFRRSFIREAMTSMLSILLLLTVLIPTAKAQAFAPTKKGDFDVSSGQLSNAAGNRLMISTAEFRAVLKHSTPQKTEMHFTYLGPTEQVFRLNNGEVRSQFGIKLRAADICNLVYVMWHVSPDQGLHISIKRNPGERTSQECKDSGYINNVKPSFSTPLPAIKVDESHVLGAEMVGSILTVTVDTNIVWRGDLGQIALQFNGPVGIRSDNAHIVFDYFVGK